MLWRILALVALIPAVAVAQAVSPTTLPHRGAVLQGLDKVTARVARLEVERDQPIRFGALNILIKDCRKSPPTEAPESAAFLQIWERKPGETESRWVFSGWMFASSPALSAMEHPVYDVWLLDCSNPETSAASPPQ